MSGVAVAVRPPARRPLLTGWGRGTSPRAGRRGPGVQEWGVGAALVLALASGGTVATVAVAPPPPPRVACSPAGAVGDLSDEQRHNATQIITVGQAMGVPRRGQVVALATAMQESTLRNINYGDRDSLGLFQQRPSMGWGTPAQVTNPTYSSRTFYRRLLAVPGWERRPVTVAAQTVQRSAYPSAYAKWERLAVALVDGTNCQKK